METKVESKNNEVKVIFKNGQKMKENFKNDKRRGLGLTNGIQKQIK